jgi:hypothetical protein
VEADLSHLPTGTAGWCALIDHALTLGDRSEVDFLELKGRLPFTEKSDRKRSAAAVSRAVLGAANRMPDMAERHLGGHGVVLVGIDEQQVVGAERVDGAVLHDSLEPYVGDDGPRWDYTYVDHPKGLVLAVVVAPPRWGDRIHACRKEYSAVDGSLTIRDGDVFVRVPGKTRPATSSDIFNLERRRDLSPTTGAHVRVGYSDTFDRVDSGSVEKLVRQLIDETAESLLGGLKTKVASNLYGGALASLMSQEDRRDPENFRNSVEAWRDHAYGKVTEVTTEFLRHELARGRWMINNESVRYLESVRVQIEFPPGVSVLIKSDTDYCDHGGPFNFRSLLPKEPPMWGALKPLGFNYSIPPRIDPISTRHFARDVEIETDEETHLTRLMWQVGDLRPNSTESGDDLFAVVTDDHLSEFVVRWRVTARGVNHVFEGNATLSCAQEPAIHLTWVKNSHPMLDSPDADSAAAGASTETNQLSAEG